MRFNYDILGKIASLSLYQSQNNSYEAEFPVTLSNVAYVGIFFDHKRPKSIQTSGGQNGLSCQ